MVCGTTDSVTTREVLLENVDMKCMQVNVLKNIARRTKTSGDMQTD